MGTSINQNLINFIEKPLFYEIMSVFAIKI